MKPSELQRLLERHLGYRLVQGRGKGSHRVLRAPGRPQILLTVHAKEFGPALVRDILVKQAGLTLDEAKELVKRG